MAPQRSTYDLQGPPINNPYIKQLATSTNNSHAAIDVLSPSSGSSNSSGIKSIFQTLTQLSSNPGKAIKVITAILLVVGGGSLIKILFGAKPPVVVEKEINGLPKTTPTPTGKIVPQRYAGLRNEGATCYLNSLLQTLFHIPLFRKSVFKMMEDKQDSIDSISKAIARVFYNLQKAQEPNEDGKTYSGSVSTRCLIESFGWSGNQVFEQHDIQEATRVLLDDLQQKMRDTSVSNVIPSLLTGMVESGIECINVKYNSFKQDVVFDVQLDVKGCRDIYASFDKYIKPELLTGDNKYHAEGHGLQDAKKYSMFTVLPKVLMLHLKRFDYTPFGTLQKVADNHQFYDEIDLTKYVKQKSKKKKEYKYHLHAVLIHKGSTVNSGHYVVAINVSEDVKKKEWYLFDDERATKISPLDAIEANFGGSYSTAYMLAYVRHDAVQEVLSPMNREDIPEILRSTFKNDDTGCSIM